jgi:hypothetical protein
MACKTYSFRTDSNFFYKDKYRDSVVYESDEIILKTAYYEIDYENEEITIHGLDKDFAKTHFSFSASSLESLPCEIEGVAGTHVEGCNSYDYSAEFDALVQCIQETLSSAGINVSGTPEAEQLALWAGPDTLQGSSDLTFDGTDLFVGGNAVPSATTSGTITVDAGWQFAGNNEIAWKKYGNIVILTIYDIGCDSPNPGTIVTTLPAAIIPSADTDVIVREDGFASGSRKVRISAAGTMARVDNLLDYEILFETVTYII